MATVKELIDSCPEFGTVTLDKNVSEIVTIQNRRLTIDLGGFTWDAPNNKTVLNIKGRSQIKILNGNMTSINAPCVHITGTDSGPSELKLGSDLNLDATNYSAVVIGAGSKVQTNATVTCSGAYGAIQGSFADPKQQSFLEVMGGTVTSQESAGILWPTDGTVSITGGTVTGATGVEIRAGNLCVYDGNIVGTAPATSSSSNKTGVSVFGAGVAVSQLSEDFQVKVMISQGNISGHTPFVDVNPEGVVGARKDVDLAIMGGVFKATNGGSTAVSSADQTDFVIEGTFNKAPAAKYISIGSCIDTKGGSTKVYRPAWEYPEGGAVGLGFTGNRRLILHIDKTIYPEGGFDISRYGFEPLAIMSANAEGGVTPYFDIARKVVRMYRNGTEVSGVLNDVTIVLIGN